jgi:thymidylate synthase (FAD)
VEVQSPSVELCKLAGQLCYMSFGLTRSRNTPEDIERYFGNILSSKHGSVLEHANVSILFWGDSRSLTHELVRHRVGIGFSQVSQRYVDGTKLRFVERPEYQRDEVLHRCFEDSIDSAAAEYATRAERLLQITHFDESMSRTERRKAVNQAARSCLPNETEAPIVVTANMRTWRHMIENRASRHAEPEIRRGFSKVLSALTIVAGALVGDYTITKLADGSEDVQTSWRKV